jgi:hypothetical protein
VPWMWPDKRALLPSIYVLGDSSANEERTRVPAADFIPGGAAPKYPSVADLAGDFHAHDLDGAIPLCVLRKRDVDDAAANFGPAMIALDEDALRVTGEVPIDQL